MAISALVIGGIAAGGLLLLGKKKEPNEAIKFVSDPEAKLGPNMAKPVADPATGSVIGVTAVDSEGTSYTKVDESDRVLIEPGFSMYDSDTGEALGCSDSLGREISCVELDKRINEASQSYAPDLVY